VVVVVTAETTGALEAYRTLPRPSLVLATFLLFDLSSRTSSYLSIKGLHLLLRLIYDRLSLLLASTASVSSIVSLSAFPIRLYFANHSSTTSYSLSISSIGLLFLLLPFLPLLPSPTIAFYSSSIFSILDSTQSTLYYY
jgi:hypothetical protein